MKNKITGTCLKTVMEKYYKQYEIVLNYKIALRKFSYDLLNRRKYRRFGIKSLKSFAEQLGLKGFGESRIYKLAAQWYFVKKFDLDVRKVASRNLWKKVYIVGKRCGLNLTKKEVWRLVLIPRNELYKKTAVVQICYPRIKLRKSKFKERFLSDCRKFYTEATIDSMILMKQTNHELYKNREFEQFGLTFNIFLKILEIGPQSYFWIRRDYLILNICDRFNIDFRDVIERQYLDKLSAMQALLDTGKYTIDNNGIELLKSSSLSEVRNNKLKYLIEV